MLAGNSIILLILENCFPGNLVPIFLQDRTVPNRSQRLIIVLNPDPGLNQ